MTEEVETRHEKDCINAKQPMPFQHFYHLVEEYLRFSPSFDRRTASYSEVFGITFLFLVT